MKKLFSSLLSVLTSAAISAGAAMPSMTSAAEDQEAVSDSAAVSISSMSFLSNYSEDYHIYGANLDDNNLAVYKVMMNLQNPSTDTLSVKLPDPVTITVSSRNITSMTDADKQAYEEAVMTACRSGIDAALFDMPEIFWLDLANMGVGTQSSTSRNWRTGKYEMTIQSINFLPVCYQEYDSMDMFMEYKQKLADAIEDFTVEGETRYEQLLSIHDTISNFTYYDASSKFISSPKGSLVEPGADCEGYAEGFKLICDKLGIPCVVVVGNIDDEDNEAHMWDYVKMEDGKWYAVDVTWDDRDGRNGVYIAYDYFLKGSVTMSEDHFPADSYGFTQITYPEISAEDYDPSKAFVTTSTTTATTTTTTTSTTTSTSTTTTTTTSASATTTKKTTEPAAKTTTTPIIYIDPSTTTTTPAAVSSTSSASTTTTIIYTDPAPSTTVTTTTVLVSSTTTSIIYTTPIPTTTTPPADPDPVEGDVNGDGKLNIADLVYCAGTVLGNIRPEHSCDADGDGLVNGFDITFIRELLLAIL